MFRKITVVTLFFLLISTNVKASPEFDYLVVVDYLVFLDHTRSKDYDPIYDTLAVGAEMRCLRNDYVIYTGIVDEDGKAMLATNANHGDEIDCVFKYRDILHLYFSFEEPWEVTGNINESRKAPMINWTTLIPQVNMQTGL